MKPARPVAKSFNAVLERMPGNLGWVIIRVPLDVHKLWGKRGQLRVKGETRSAGSPPRRAGFAFRTSLFPTVISTALATRRARDSGLLRCPLRG